MFLHYLSHRFSFLWRLHAVHHGVTAALWLQRRWSAIRCIRSSTWCIGTAPLVIAGMPIRLRCCSASPSRCSSSSSTRTWPMSSGSAAQPPLHRPDPPPAPRQLGQGRRLQLRPVPDASGTSCSAPSRPSRRARSRPSDMGVDEVPELPQRLRRAVSGCPFRYQAGTGRSSRCRRPPPRRRPDGRGANRDRTSRRAERRLMGGPVYVIPRRRSPRRKSDASPSRCDARCRRMTGRKYLISSRLRIGRGHPLEMDDLADQAKASWMPACHPRGAGSAAGAA